MIYASEYIPTFDKSIIKKGKKSYIATFLAFDSETSHNHDEENPVGWVYQWAFRENDNRVVGRTPQEFIKVLRKICEYIGETESKILIYVHNLSYDIEYFKNFLVAEFGKPEILATAPHEYIFFKVGIFEFRCSYKLSNKSLEKWGKDLDTEHKKLVGAIDYEVIRTPMEELTQTDWDYMLGDIDTLYECIIKQMQIYNDTLVTIPLTSTGYVRRECRKHFRKDNKNWKRFLNTRVDLEVYKLLEREFAGAISHGNRFYAGKTVSGIIRHRDFRSHYPSQQRVRTFPVGKFNLWGDHISLEELEELTDEYCCLSEIILHDVELKDKKITIPFLSADKCKKGKLGDIYTVEDNGRILKLNGYVSLVVTEIDLELIFRQYNIESYDIVKTYVSKRGKIPQFIIDTVDEFMLGKTKYKILYEHSKSFDDFTNLMKSKAGLNGIYGMSAQRPIKPEIVLDDNMEFDISEDFTDKVMSEKLDDFYKSRNNFMRFCFGCWTTSYARMELIDYCEIIGYENVLYCDTDSAFYISTPEIETRIENANKIRKDYAMKIGAYIEYEGKIVTYDEFCDEEENITDFRFLHSKCYGYMCDNKLHLTIAGVSAYEDSTRQYSREEELGTLDNLEEGKIFTRCGGTKSKYVNTNPFLYEYNGEIIECASACIITKTHKELHNMLNIYDSLIEWSVR